MCEFQAKLDKQCHLLQVFYNLFQFIIVGYVFLNSLMYHICSVIETFFIGYLIKIKINVL